MRATYKPAGQDPQTWRFVAADVPCSQAEMIEKRFGGSFDEWQQGVLQGKARARRVLLWHLLCRTHGLLRYEDVPDFTMGEFVLERELDELVAHRAALATTPIDDPEVKEIALAHLDSEIEAERARLAESDGEGKADSPSSDGGTP